MREEAKAALIGAAVGALVGAGLATLYGGWLAREERRRREEADATPSQEKSR